jgi:hypothetical protein
MRGIVRGPLTLPLPPPFQGVGDMIWRCTMARDPLPFTGEGGTRRKRGGRVRVDRDALMLRQARHEGSCEILVLSASKDEGTLAPRRGLREVRVP